MKSCSLHIKSALYCRHCHLKMMGQYIYKIIIKAIMWLNTGIGFGVIIIIILCLITRHLHCHNKKHNSLNSPYYYHHTCSTNSFQYYLRISLSKPWCWKRWAASTYLKFNLWADKALQRLLVRLSEWLRNWKMFILDSMVYKQLF